MLCIILFFFFKQKTAYEMRISDWSSDVCSSDLGTNVAGFTDLLARLIAIFRQQPFESSIIAVSSLAGETSVPFQAVYGASKAYVSTLMRALSIELAGTGVSVGSFAPGGIDTDIAAQIGRAHV